MKTMWFWVSVFWFIGIIITGFLIGAGIGGCAAYPISDIDMMIIEYWQGRDTVNVE